MKHVVELSQGLCRPEIQGALQKLPVEKFSVEKFHQATRVSQRFTTALKVAHGSLPGVSAQETAGQEGNQKSSVD